MDILERIEDQIATTGLPLVGITLVAVPCPDTPVILTLHWHGFIREKLADVEQAETVSYAVRPLPASRDPAALRRQPQNGLSLRCFRPRYPLSLSRQSHCQVRGFSSLFVS